MKATVLLLFSILLFSSCTPYQKVTRGVDAGLKYNMAEAMYVQGKYKKALKLMEQIVPVYRGKPQAEKLMFMYANTYFNLEDYYLAGYQFERFTVSYPKSDSIELAAYKSAVSYYELSPVYSLDQKDTYTGLEKLQNFIDIYPNSEYRLDANKKVKALTHKLEKKNIEVAKQYLKTGEALNSYKNAIEAFDNFISDFPGSEYRKDAFFGKYEAAYELALHSIPQKINGRLLIAKEYYDEYLKYFENSDPEFIKKGNKILEDIKLRLGNTETQS